jgi:putative hydrolase of the HAD superfamily
VGTLIYPDPPVAAAYEAIGKAQGLSLSLSDIKSRFAAAYDRVFRRALDLATSDVRERQRWRVVVAEVFRESPHLVDELLEQLWHHFARPQHWPMFADVPPVWEDLRARGYILGIASNFDGRLRDIVAGHACLSSCPHVFVSTELGHAKPSESFFTGIQRQLNAPPEEILMVGDDLENDVLAPRRMGWQSLALDRAKSTSPSLLSLRDLAEKLP